MNQCTQELINIINKQDDALRVRGSLAAILVPSDEKGLPMYRKAPWIDPPEGFLSFDQVGSAVIPAVGSQVTVLTLIVPTGMDGVIKRLSNNVEAAGFTNGSGELVWRLLADGKPIRNYENITAQKGSAEQPRQVDGIRIYSGQTISYVLVHAANGAFTGQNTNCTLGGYFYPNNAT
jgi:hypothetical protein